MFSSSFESSATSGVETGTRVSQTGSQTARAASVHAGVSPPTTFGVVRSVKSVRPGSTRSGENASAKSSPARRPDSSSSGAMYSRVVPGKVVLSSTAVWRAPGDARVARPDDAGEHAARAQQRAELGLAVGVQRRGHADEDRLGLLE